MRRHTEGAGAGCTALAAWAATGAYLCACWFHPDHAPARGRASCGSFGGAYGALAAGSGAAALLLDTLLARLVYDNARKADLTLAEQTGVAPGGVCYGYGCFGPTFWLGAALCVLVVICTVPCLARRLADDAKQAEAGALLRADGATVASGGAESWGREGQARRVEASPLLARDAEALDPGPDPGSLARV